MDLGLAVRAIACGVNELNVAVSVSNTYNQFTARLCLDQLLPRFNKIADLSPDMPATLNATIATACGCPFEGGQSVGSIMALIARLLKLGAQEITLADSTAVADPRQVAALVRLALSQVSANALTLHFHNSRDMGLANVIAAYETGARHFDDASLGGLGTCPFAAGAPGNICTEDLVHICHEIGIPTGNDLSKLIETSRWLSAKQRRLDLAASSTSDPPSKRLPQGPSADFDYSGAYFPVS
jgi:hydroxymethylglutaryl-CoA lyase